jgi:hypothetical protein
MYQDEAFSPLLSFKTECTLQAVLYAKEDFDGPTR